MSDSSADLLSKADALLSRWRGGASPLNPPEDYPVLTEVVESATPENALPATAETGDVEARLRQEVFQAIEPGLKAMLADGVQGRLEIAVRQLAAELAGQMSNDISGLVEEAVRRAVARKLAPPHSENPSVDR